MRTWGSAIEPWHAATLASHLAALYGPGQPPARLVRVPASQKEARVSALPDGPFGGGDPKLGRAVFAAQCATCHGADGRGGRLGTNLARRPLLYRTREFARWVREGRGRMPAFVLATDREIAAVLAHLRARR
jgi:mono/diheme cytochrome c family protein